MNKSRRDVRIDAVETIFHIRPFGTRTPIWTQPSVETLAYYRESLRDKKLVLNMRRFQTRFQRFAG